MTFLRRWLLRVTGSKSVISQHGSTNPWGAGGGDKGQEHRWILKVMTFPEPQSPYELFPKPEWTETIAGSLLLPPLPSLPSRILQHIDRGSIQGAK